MTCGGPECNEHQRSSRLEGHTWSPDLNSFLSVMGNDVT